MIYDPVCGNDNEDYANQCLMEYEACSKQTDISVKNKGECKKVMPGRNHLLSHFYTSALNGKVY